MPKPDRTLSTNTFGSSRRCLERIPEHDLSDAHESRLIGDLAEARITNVICTRTCTSHFDAVEQVQHLDFYLSCFAFTKPERLHERGVDILLRRGAHRGQRARRGPDGVRRRESEGGGADPCC